MEKKSRREWRKLIKKLQRKRRRVSKAKHREEESKAKLADPLYQQWLEQQLQLEEFQQHAEQRQHDAEEEAWLRRELIAQQQFRIVLERRQADEAAQEAERLRQEEELEQREAVKRKRSEEKARLAAEAAMEFELIMTKMEMYLTDIEISTPKELKRHVETRPDQRPCEFYERTNCCRFGVSCAFNHKRPLLARIILIHHFFVHPLLKPVEHEEYASADSHLESSEQDLREDYDAFFGDVVPELESFGKVVNFRTLRNVLPHLRGNVYVEYEDKRSALKAFTKLQGRYYASKPLVVEFSNIVTWRGAVCGLSFARKCPRGDKCSFLHLFRNPGNKYNTALEFTKGSEQCVIRKNPNLVTPLLTWNDVCGTNPRDIGRNWRWSESPELETSPKTDVASIRTAKKSASEDENKKNDNSKGSNEKKSSHKRKKKRKVKKEKEKRAKDHKSSKNEKNLNDQEPHKKKQKRRSRS